MNTFIIAGNIGQNAEKKEINGKDYVTFSVAENQKKVNRTTGEEVSVSNWYNVLYRGDKIRDYLLSGVKVLVVGELSINIYRLENDGSVRVSRDIFANNIQFLSKKEDTNKVDGDTEKKELDKDGVTSSESKKK